FTAAPTRRPPDLPPRGPPGAGKRPRPRRHATCRPGRCTCRGGRRRAAGCDGPSAHFGRRATTRSPALPGRACRTGGRQGRRKGTSLDPRAIRRKGDRVTVSTAERRRQARRLAADLLSVERGAPPLRAALWRLSQDSLAIATLANRPLRE